MNLNKGEAHGWCLLEAIKQCLNLHVRKYKPKGEKCEADTARWLQPWLMQQQYKGCLQKNRVMKWGSVAHGFFFFYTACSIHLFHVGWCQLSQRFQDAPLSQVSGVFQLRSHCLPSPSSHSHWPAITCSICDPAKLLHNTASLFVTQLPLGLTQSSFSHICRATAGTGTTPIAGT